MLCSCSPYTRPCAVTLAAIQGNFIIAKSGSDEHPILRRSSAAGASVIGSALAVALEDIAKADAYEVADYRRIAVTLASGRNAYVYVAAEDL